MRMQTSASKTFLIFAVIISAATAVFAQAENKKGSIKFTAQVEIDGKTQRLDRKRFYLIRGSREQHAELLKTIAETPVTSRDCFYENLRRGGRKISDEYICWLKTNDCESAYCREIKTAEEALAVPEFAAAYRQGLREYKKPLLALKWLTTNLSDDVRNGFYEQQKPVIETLVALAKTAARTATEAKSGAGSGFQSVMTDRLGGAFFLDIDIVPPEGKKTETYLVTNLLPAIFGDTGYVWTCELEIDPAKPQAQFVLKTELSKKKCDAAVKKQTESCLSPECAKPVEQPATD